jgi:hypothetical protein
MKKNIFIFSLLVYLCIFSSTASSLVPLNQWASTKQFTTLSIPDTVYLSLRCSIAFNINKEIIEEYSNLKADGLRDKVNAHRSVYATGSIIMMKDKSKTVKDDYMKSLPMEVKNINDAYFSALKKNMPVPHSMMNELLAGDIGFCNAIDRQIMELHKLMQKTN